MKMGIDPITHKPVSQVLSDLGSISCLTTNTDNHQMSFVNNKKDLMMSNNMLPTTITEPFASQNSSKNNSMVVDHTQENVLQHVFSEAASSSNSSSSSSNLNRLSSPQYSYSCQTTQSSSFDWSEFLHSDPFMWSEFQQCGDLQRVMSSLNLSELMQQSEGELSNKQGEGCSGAVPCDASMDLECQINKQSEGNHHPSSGNSFVDGILDRDSEIRAAFPEFLDASFDY